MRFVFLLQAKERNFCHPIFSQPGMKLCSTISRPRGIWCGGRAAKKIPWELSYQASRGRSHNLGNSRRVPPSSRRDLRDLSVSGSASAIANSETRICRKPAWHILGPKLMFAKRDKQDPTRLRQTSLAAAGTNFTKPRRKVNFGPSRGSSPALTSHKTCVDCGPCSPQPALLLLLASCSCPLLLSLSSFDMQSLSWVSPPHNPRIACRL